MIHIHYFITRKSTLDDAAFHRYWSETHGPIAAKIKQSKRYVQSHRIPYASSNSPYDGEAEVLIDDLAALDELRKNPAYLEGALADERNFIDLSRVEWMATQDHVIVDGPTGSALIKGVWQHKRKRGMPLGEFRKYWIEVHGALGKQVPGLRRYVQSHLIDEAYVRRGGAIVVRQPRGDDRGVRVAARQGAGGGWPELHRPGDAQALRRARAYRGGVALSRAAQYFFVRGSQWANC
jgi:uncharacterized protein (TIGR02118 family)